MVTVVSSHVITTVHNNKKYIEVVVIIKYLVRKIACDKKCKFFENIEFFLRLSFILFRVFFFLVNI